MPILRRYVRVSKFTVLETRIFLPSPADLPWLTRTPAMSRVFAEVKHLVLPMLIEAREQRQTGGKAKAKQREVVAAGNLFTALQSHGGSLISPTEDFEVSIYLTGAGTLHAVLRKTREIKPAKKLQGNSTRLMDAARGDEVEPVVIREEDEDDAPIDLTDIPEAPADGHDSDEEPLFLPGHGSEDSDDDFIPNPKTQKWKRKESEDVNEDKKKLRFRTEYEGFTIYDKVLCLVVTRKEKRKEKPTVGAARGNGLIEGWIAMSQATRDGVSIEE